MIDDRFDILGASPDSKLPVRAGSFMQDSLDMIHLAPAAKLGYFIGYELDKLVNQTARVSFAFPTEIDQLAIDPIARGAPAIFIE